MELRMNASMNGTLLAHALSLRSDRVREALGSVLPHHTLSRALSICLWSGPICILPADHVGAPDYLRAICELFVSYSCAQPAGPYASIPTTQI